MSYIAHASRAILLAFLLILIYAVPAGAATYSDADVALGKEGPLGQDAAQHHKAAALWLMGT